MFDGIPYKELCPLRLATEKGDWTTEIKWNKLNEWNIQHID